MLRQLIRRQQSLSSRARRSLVSSSLSSLSHSLQQQQQPALVLAASMRAYTSTSSPLSAGLFSSSSSSSNTMTCRTSRTFATSVQVPENNSATDTTQMKTENKDQKPDDKAEQVQENISETDTTQTKTENKDQKPEDKADKKADEEDGPKVANAEDMATGTKKQQAAVSSSSSSSASSSLSESASAEPAASSWSLSSLSPHSIASFVKQKAAELIEYMNRDVQEVKELVLKNKAEKQREEDKAEKQRLEDLQQRTEEKAEQLRKEAEDKAEKQRLEIKADQQRREDKAEKQRNLSIATVVTVFGTFGGLFLAIAKYSQDQDPEHQRKLHIDNLVAKMVSGDMIPSCADQVLPLLSEHLHDLVAELRRERPLLLVEGPTGIGKSTTVVQACRNYQEDGGAVLFISLKDVAEASSLSLAEIVADKTGLIKCQGIKDALTIAKSKTGKKVLVVIDDINKVVTAQSMQLGTENFLTSIQDHSFTNGLSITLLVSSNYSVHSPISKLTGMTGRLNVVKVEPSQDEQMREFMKTTLKCLPEHIDVWVPYFNGSFTSLSELYGFITGQEKKDREDKKQLGVIKQINKMIEQDKEVAAGLITGSVTAEAAPVGLRDYLRRLAATGSLPIDAAEADFHAQQFAIDANLARPNQTTRSIVPYSRGRGIALKKWKAAADKMAAEEKAAADKKWFWQR
jgi:hypothetical protein